jgi:protoheme IX farnesyltransferase
VRTPYNTLVGALVGAVPPVIGWTAAAGGFQAGAWVLAAILFVWQIPHFLALAWVYREDYARGGFRMLPVVDRSGVRTCQAVVLYAATLVPATLMLTVVGVVGVVYASAALSLGAGLFVLAGLLYLRRTEVAARRVFLASVIYLPLLLGAMVVDRQPW